MRLWNTPGRNTTIVSLIYLRMAVSTVIKKKKVTSKTKLGATKPFAGNERNTIHTEGLCTGWRLSGQFYAPHVLFRGKAQNTDGKGV